MSSRVLPARPHLDHLKAEAKTIRRAFRAGDPDARERVTAVLGAITDLKLTHAQRVIAREYGFASWSDLRTHVAAARSLAYATEAFLSAVAEENPTAAKRTLATEPRIAETDLHSAAVLGRVETVRRLLAERPERVSQRAEPLSAEPLFWLCLSPFHGESPERDDDLAAAAATLLDAGADPDARGTRYRVSALYGVTGHHHVPRIAGMLLEAGADPNDGESAFHAAERFHVEALELLLSHGVDLNRTGDWGNTPLYFLLRYWDVASMPKVEQGLRWLLDHGADPDVLCGKERESSLHVAVRTGQDPALVRLLLDRGADPRARRGDGRTPWLLARRGGHDELASMLEDAGAEREPLTPQDELLAACGRGDAREARRLSSPELVASLEETDLALLPDAAARGRMNVAEALVAAGLPVDTADAQGATALHHAAIHGSASLVRALLDRGADHTIRDREHRSDPLGWATFGSDYVTDPQGDYEETVRAFLEAGVRPTRDHHTPEHPGVRAVLLEAPGSGKG